MCLIVEWMHTCGCMGEGDYPELCKAAILETKTNPMGPIIGKKCAKHTLIQEVDSLCPHHEMDEVHQAHVRNFFHAVSLPCCAIIRPAARKSTLALLAGRIWPSTSYAGFPRVYTN